MGAKQSITVVKEDEKKEDDNKSIVDQDGRSCTGTVGSLTSGSPGLLCPLGDQRSLCGRATLAEDIDTVILDKNPIDISGVDIIRDPTKQVNSVPIVDTVGCSCMKTTINTVDSPASEEIVCTDKTNTETIVKCECGNQCKCVPPCECKSPKSQNSSVSSFRLFTKTADLQDRFVSFQERFNKLDESFNDMGKRMNDMDERIVVLETLSKKMTEYVPLTAIPYCRICETIVLNGRVCDCGLAVE